MIRIALACSASIKLMFWLTIRHPSQDVVQRGVRNDEK